MDELRYSRLEGRVDEIKDDVSEVKADQKILNHTMDELKQYVKESTEAVKEHVVNDNKIINEITPMIEEFKFQKETKERKMSSLREWSVRIGIPATILGIIGTILKASFSF